MCSHKAGTTFAQYAPNMQIEHVLKITLTQAFQCCSLRCYSLFLEAIIDLISFLLLPILHAVITQYQHSTLRLYNLINVLHLIQFITADGCFTMEQVL